MSRVRYKPLMVTALGLLIVLSCSKSFLEREPLGNVSETTLATREGVDGLLIGAYSLLDGIGTGGLAGAPAVSNWVFGGVASDDAHKGSQYGDEPPIESIENYTIDPTNPYLPIKWRLLYGGVQRANDVLRLLPKVPENLISAQEATRIRAEAIFVRSVFHLQAIMMWRNVPYIDETVSFAEGNYNVPNTTAPWANVEADFLFASQNLPATQNEAGRANSWAAKAFLVKCYMFQHKYAEAKPILEDIRANGVTSSGDKYALLTNFADNFRATRKNNAESVFAVQHTVKDGALGQNGNGGDVLNFPLGGPARCCSFYQPSFSLVNSFKTDAATGLPLINTFNNTDVKNDQGIKSQDPFIPETGTLDPRLDYTVGRRGIPYLDWGLHPGQAWIGSQSAAGPYSSIKNVYYQADQDIASDNFQGWAPGQATSNNYNLIRFADVILWAAEVEVEAGSLQKAEEYVNMVRGRAANPATWVHTYIDNSDPLKGFTNTPAANYRIGLYNGEFAANGQAFAREAVRFERKLELAMEGHRFFDLQRYDNGTGYMADVLNSYIQHETNIPGYDYLILEGATFKKGKNEIYPIPQSEIDLSSENGASVLKQNPNY